ncbi:MAG: penicillin-binding protein activator [Rickettsiaceae bacterium]|nr:penicillin-binding protein activator [Rickettsiaceae bacterium]
MLNIKQKFLKFIISFACLVSISACEQLGVKNIVGKNVVDIAILMPMSGPEAELSKEYAQMVKIGLSDGAKTKIRVTSYDSADKDKLNESLDKIFETGTDLIIGPIYSEATQIVANKVKGKGTLVISLSNNPVLADQQVFIHGHAPMRQLEQLTNYFLDNNYKNYIALLPSGRHSNSVSKILRDMISNANGTLARVEFYGNTPEDIAKSVKIVSDSVDNLNENDFNLTQPVIILADDSATLQILYNNAHKYNLDKKAIISGDSRADIDSSPPTNITFTGSLNITNTDLVERAKKAGINHISFMHAIAYDAGKMASNYIGTSYNKTKFLSDMNGSEPFVGISGKIHFTDSIAQRQYDIIIKENGEYRTVEKKEN